MKNIKLIRVDDRLIHGQVVTSWITQTGNKNLSNTAKILYSLFLDRLKFAVQNGWVDGEGDLFVIYPKSEMKKDLNTTRYGVDQAVQEWKLNEFNGEQVLILLKKVDALKRLYEQGLYFDSVQIGGLASGPERKPVVKAIGLSEQDAIDLNFLSEYGVNVYSTVGQGTDVEITIPVDYKNDREKDNEERTAEN